MESIIPIHLISCKPNYIYVHIILPYIDIVNRNAEIKNIFVKSELRVSWILGILSIYFVSYTKFYG